jgi:hypothetical protein
MVHSADNSEIQTQPVDANFFEHYDSNGGELIPSVAIDRIIALRTEGLKKYFEALEILKEARKLFNFASGDQNIYGFDQCVHDAVRWESHPNRNEKAIKKVIDSKIWRRLINDTGMYTLMSRKQQDEWDSQLDGETMPEITLDTVLATFTQLNASKADTFELGVIDVFRALSWEYKTNNPCRMGKKIILSRLLETWGKGYIRASYSSVAQLDDLAKPFYILEGKNVPDHRIADGSAFTEFFNREGFSGAVYEGEYFTVRYFKKGSAHIVFKRPELLDKINAIVARHYPSMLPPRV